MISPTRKAAYLASTALVLSLLSHSAQAYPTLPNLTNLDFTQYTGSAPKGAFSSVDPVGWTGGTGLIAIDSTTPGAQASDSVGGTITTYGSPSGSYSGNYVQADGNPQFESGFNYLVTGLTPGQTYTLSFYQGASQQTTFTGDTTNQWIVSLGKSGLYVAQSSDPTAPNSGCGSSCVYENTDPSASIVASSLMTVPTGTVVGWEYQTVNLTADASSDLLSFLAWGDNGNTTNLPPIAFLAGVDSPPGLGTQVPEPASLSLLGVGLLGMAGVARRRRKTAGKA